MTPHDRPNETSQVCILSAHRQASYKPGSRFPARKCWLLRFPLGVDRVRVDLSSIRALSKFARLEIANLEGLERSS